MSDKLFLEGRYLENLPGARYWDGHVIGSPDVLAAAAKRLSIEHTAQLAAPSTCELPATLRTYQRDGVAQLLGTLREFGGALLADDVGLGKTAQSIGVMKQLGGRCLIVCPAYVRMTWEDELVKWWPDVKAFAVTPGRKWLLPASEAQVVVCSYEMLGKVLDAAFDNVAPMTLVFDEAHYMSGRKSKRSKEAERAAVLAQYKLAITATPMWSKPRDLYQILRVVLGKFRFGSPWDFDKCYCDGKPNEWGGWDNGGARNLDELKLRLSFYMLRREKRDVLKDLPPLSRQVVWVDATAEASSVYHEMRMSLESRPGSVARALQATLRGKLDAAVELAAQAPEGRFLLFTYTRADAQAIWAALQARGIGCYVVTGEDSVPIRKEKAAAAKEKRLGLVATIDSMGAGVNLQGVASYGVFHALDWVPAKLLQAEGRLHRLGQLENVHWVYLAMRDSMDEAVVKTVVNKLDNWRTLTGSESLGEVADDLGAEVDASNVSADVLRSLYDEL